MFKSKKIIWWGRSDVSYSRNGVLRSAMNELGVGIEDFYPWFSFSAGIEATFKSLDKVDAIWVPCFRQRDLFSAATWATKKDIPLIFDPLISAYDKQVFERKKFLQTSQGAKRLLQWESGLFQMADVVIADTVLHAQYFEEMLGVDSRNIHVVPVSAEENLFHTKEPMSEREHGSKCKVLFYGNYLELHGVDVISDAIIENQNQSIEWTLVGDGATRGKVEKKCEGISSVNFVDWIEYEKLPNAIHDSDLVLGIFNTGDKAKRVIPNKVYQALACGRPVVTMQSLAYPKALRESPNSGIYWVEAGNPTSLLEAIEASIGNDHQKDCMKARSSYDNYFSISVVRESLGGALDQAFSLNLAT